MSNKIISRLGLNSISVTTKSGKLRKISTRLEHYTPTGAGPDYVVAANIATITQAGHLLVVGQFIEVTTETDPTYLVKGYYQVLTVPNSNDFTIQAIGTTLVSSANIEYIPMYAISINVDSLGAITIPLIGVDNDEFEFTDDIEFSTSLNVSVIKNLGSTANSTIIWDEDIF